MKSFSKLFYSILLCCIIFAGEVGAAVTVDVRPSPDGAAQYVSISNVNNAAVIDFKIFYDSSALADPVVVDGKLVGEAAAIREINVLKPGVLRVVYVSVTGFKKPGDLATVTFTKKGSLKAADPKIESEAFSTEGGQLATRTNVNTGSLVISSVGDKRNYPDSPAGESNKSGSMWDRAFDKRSVGSVQASGQQAVQNTEPLNVETAGDVRTGEALTPQAVLPEESGPVVKSPAGTAAEQSAGNDKKTEPVAADTKNIVSVIERLKEYGGARTLKGFAKLFEEYRSRLAGVEQVPGVFVAEDKKTLKVIVSVAGDTGVPSFSLKGANLKGIRSVSEKKMELEIMPQKGKLDIRLTIVNQKQTLEVPLIVVPPVSAATTGLSEQVVEKLLSKADARNKALLYDLNLDGKQDYLDDYILVAHWLIQQDLKKTPDVKPAVPR